MTFQTFRSVGFLFTQKINYVYIMVTYLLCSLYQNKEENKGRYLMKLDWSLCDLGHFSRSYKSENSYTSHVFNRI